LFHTYIVIAEGIGPSSTISIEIDLTKSNLPFHPIFTGGAGSSTRELPARYRFHD
jgi:hypothetical protein